jgi:hypothetical protein
MCCVMLLNLLLQAALAAKTDQQAATAVRCRDLEVQLARAIEQGTANSQRLAALKVRHCGDMAVLIMAGC